MHLLLVQQQPSHPGMQQSAQQREFLRQQEDYRRQQQQAAEAQRQNEMVQHQLQQEQDRLAREREELQLQKEAIAREEQQRRQQQIPESVSVKDTVRGILESSKFGNDFGFERPKSAGSRVTEARIICRGLSFVLHCTIVGLHGVSISYLTTEI